MTALTVLGTGDALSLEQLQRSHSLQPWQSQRIGDAEVSDEGRTPAENLAHIRAVLKPAVSDLAPVFGVSRQSVYNWAKGDPVAADNAARLEDLAKAADVLVRSGMTINASLLKRKFVSGRTLMQVAQSGDSAQDAAVMLVQIHQRESLQRESMAARFANRKKKSASADFDLPLSNDRG